MFIVVDVTDKQMPSELRCPSGCSFRINLLLPSNAYMVSVRLGIQRFVQPETVSCRVSRNSSIRVCFRDQFFPSGVNEETDKIRTHVVASEVRNHLRQVYLVKVDVDKHQAVEIFCRLRIQAAVRPVDASVAVVR